MKLQFNPKEHAYWLDGRRCKGATTVAKIPDDPYKLNQWRIRMAAIGVATKPGLAESIAAHHDQRDKVEEFADLGIEYAKANDASRRGTDAHRIAERIDLGEDIVDTPLARQVRAAWGRALDDAGLEIVPEYVERIVVHPDLLIAGTFDRLVRHQVTGRLYVLDLKTGPNAIKYPHAVAIQLAIYANAPLIAGPLPATGGTTTVFEPMPDNLDRDWAYIVHMPSDSEVTVPKVKIDAGWQEGMEICRRALKWRARKDLIETPISAAVWAPTPRLVTADGAVEPTQDPPPAPAPVPSTTSTTGNHQQRQTPSGSLEQALSRGMGTTSIKVTGDDPVEGELDAGPTLASTTPTANRVEWIRTWIRVCADHDQLARQWPPRVPVPTNGGWRLWTNDDINAIAAACSDVDRNNGAPLFPPDPSTPTPTGIQTRS